MRRFLATLTDWVAPAATVAPIEYAFIAALLASVVLVTVTGVGVNLTTVFSSVR
jgi:Flp pilus assembly pilin Flp